MFQRMVEERHRDMGRTIARLRTARGWTQPDLAHEAGLSIGTISRLENGKHEGRGGTIRAVAQALDVDVQSLLPGAEPEPGDLSQLDRIEETLDAMASRMEEMYAAIMAAIIRADEQYENLAELQRTVERLPQARPDAGARSRAPRTRKTATG